ncbi:STAS domain-containing protein [Actinomadura miaoliensis]|uniref:Anti-sigma factor antagonist n=1 Tax=Actinomadura miaoliensis TaxID=430685 RepID=A0ABP7WVG4_9ACTN
MQPLEVTSRPHDGFTVVRLRGELDIATAEELRLRLRLARREHGDRVVLDLAELEFMDSHGLSVIINCYRSVTEAGGSLALVAPRPIVWRALEITGLHQRLTIVGTVDEAVATAPEPAGGAGEAPESETPEGGEDAGPAADQAAAPVAAAGST